MRDHNAKRYLQTFNVGLVRGNFSLDTFVLFYQVTDADHVTAAVFTASLKFLFAEDKIFKSKSFFFLILQLEHMIGFCYDHIQPVLITWGLKHCTTTIPRY